MILQEALLTEIIDCSISFTSFNSLAHFRSPCKWVRSPGCPCLMSRSYHTFHPVLLFEEDMPAWPGLCDSCKLHWSGRAPSPISMGCISFLCRHIPYQSIWATLNFCSSTPVSMVSPTSWSTVMGCSRHLHTVLWHRAWKLASPWGKILKVVCRSDEMKANLTVSSASWHMAGASKAGSEAKTWLVAFFIVLTNFVFEDSFRFTAKLSR